MFHRKQKTASISISEMKTFINISSAVGLTFPTSPHRIIPNLGDEKIDKKAYRISKIQDSHLEIINTEQYSYQARFRGFSSRRGTNCSQFNCASANLKSNLSIEPNSHVIFCIILCVCFGKIYTLCRKYSYFGVAFVRNTFGGVGARDVFRFRF